VGGDTYAGREGGEPIIDGGGRGDVAIAAKEVAEEDVEGEAEDREGSEMVDRGDGGMGLRKGRCFFGWRWLRR